MAAVRSSASLTVEPVTGTLVPIMSTRAIPDSVFQGLFGQTRTAILSLLYGHADESFYLRQLVRETGAGNGAVQREVKQLSDAGLIVRKTVGNLVFYQANRKSPVFSELRGLLLKTARRAQRPARSAGAAEKSYPSGFRLWFYCRAERASQ